MLINGLNLNSQYLNQNYSCNNTSLENLVSIFLSNAQTNAVPEESTDNSQLLTKLLELLSSLINKNSSKSTKEVEETTQIKTESTTDSKVTNNLRLPTNEKEEKIYNALNKYTHVEHVEPGLISVRQGNGTYSNQEKPYVDGYNKAMQTAKEHYNGASANLADDDIDTAIENKMRAKGQLARIKQTELMTKAADLYMSNNNIDLSKNDEIQSMLNNLKSMKTDLNSLSNEMINDSSKNLGTSAAETMDNIIKSVELCITNPKANPVVRNRIENGT